MYFFPLPQEHGSFRANFMGEFGWFCATKRQAKFKWLCKAYRPCLVSPSTLHLDLHRPILDAVKSPLRPQQPTRVLQVQCPHLSWNHLAAPLDLGKNFGLVGVHPVLIQKCHLRVPEPRLITEKDLLELASVQASMAQAFGLFGSHVFMI